MQIICTLLQTDNHASTSSLNFLQVRCSSWCPANSVKALKAMKAFRSYKHTYCCYILRESQMMQNVHCSCASVCLSHAAFPHYCMDPDVTWRNGSGASSFVLLGGFAIDALVSLLWQQSMNAKCQRVLVLAQCLVLVAFLLIITIIIFTNITNNYYHYCYFYRPVFAMMSAQVFACSLPRSPNCCSAISL